ncbi:hypothetical protein E2P81_ATG11631 [Venturia nashicola]|nr:hypothetical protein E2P81_ATG11631 [Venturia nashicola]
MPLQVPLLLAALFAIGIALPNSPQITPAPSIAHLEAKRATDSGNEALVGYYTESEGGAWQTNTCGESATWSTSGQYGACAGKPSQSLYTSCSGNVLVGAEGSTTQSCGATWSVCTTLYQATDTTDTAPFTYLICDVSTGLSKRYVVATTASASGAETTSRQPTQTSSAAASSTTLSSSPASTARSTSLPTDATSEATPAATTAPPTVKKFASGGIAGVILAILAVMGVVLLIALWFLKRRRNKMKQQGVDEMADTSPHPPVELPVEEDLKELPSNESVAAELHGHTGHESRGGR